MWIAEKIDWSKLQTEDSNKESKKSQNKEEVREVWRWKEIETKKKRLHILDTKHQSFLTDARQYAPCTRLQLHHLDKHAVSDMIRDAKMFYILNNQLPQKLLFHY